MNEFFVLVFDTASFGFLVICLQRLKGLGVDIFVVFGLGKLQDPG